MHDRQRYFRSLSVGCLFAALFTGAVCAQTTSGTITGTITDQSGAVVPDAKIKLIDELTKDTREATGSESGEFVFAALRPSTYTVVVEKPGFQGFRRTGVVVATSERVALGAIRLTVGQ